MTLPNHDFLDYTLSKPINDTIEQVVFATGSAQILGHGIIQLEPIAKAKHSVVLSAGIHGNETAPIELLNTLLKQILDGELTLSIRLLIILGHPEAMRTGERFCDVNLNRLFCGAWRKYNGQEVARAQQLEHSVAQFFEAHQTGCKLHYDLHTAIRGSEYEKFAVHPFTHGQPYQQQQFDFYAAIGLEAVLLSHQPTTTFSYHSYINHGAQAATIELGQVHPFGQNDLLSLEKLSKALQLLIEQGELSCADATTVKLFSVVEVLIKDADDYLLKIADDVKNFTAFEAGFELATSNVSHYQIKQSGDAIVFPNVNLPVGQRAGLVVRQDSWETFRTV